MSLRLSELCLPVFVRGFDVLDHLLARAEAHGGIDPVSARLADDMLPLSGQVQRASDTAKFAIARVADIESPSFADEETTWSELHQRIAATRDWLRSVDPTQVDAGESRRIVRAFRDRQHDFSASDYLLQFALPNFFFHVTTAHDILRHKGVAVGKLDYLGFNA
jgi:uncharacterized protein